MTNPQRAANAVQYLRMSTEMQDYSIELQIQANTNYARERGYSIIRTYQDLGISGLGIERRDGLKRLLADVLGGPPDFSVVLVYDVSRWGRFQNPDQAAHYEFLCNEAGVRIEYCAEPFANDGTMSAGLMKGIKRLMAAEFSRELSDKLARTKHGLRWLGYWQGGPPGYGLRRQIVSRSGRVLRTCEYGDFNGQPGTHTVVVWGPPEEIATVRRIYRLFLREGLKLKHIAAKLNEGGVPAEGGGPWRWYHVRQVLTNEKYAGAFVVGRYRQKLGRQEQRPPEEWRRLAGLVKPIVSRKVFAAAQAEIARRRRPPTNEELLAYLPKILARHGALSACLLDNETPHSAEYYRRRFGDLFELFGRFGYEPRAQQVRMRELGRSTSSTRRGNGAIQSDQVILQNVREVLAREGYLSSPLLERSPGVPTSATLRRRFGTMAKLYELVGYDPSSRQRRQMATLGRAGVHAPMHFGLRSRTARAQFATGGAGEQLPLRLVIPER